MTNIKEIYSFGFSRAMQRHVATHRATNLRFYAKTRAEAEEMARAAEERSGRWHEFTPDARKGSDRWSSSARGWLYPSADPEGASLGNYCDYGPDHCRYDADQDTQPGTIHCVVYRSKATGTTATRYAQNVEEARAWIESESTT